MKQVLFSQDLILGSYNLLQNFPCVRDCASDPNRNHQYSIMRRRITAPSLLNSRDLKEQNIRITKCNYLLERWDKNWSVIVPHAIDASLAIWLNFKLKKVVLGIYNLLKDLQEGLTSTQVETQRVIRPYMLVRNIADIFHEIEELSVAIHRCGVDNPLLDIVVGCKEMSTLLELTQVQCFSRWVTYCKDVVPPLLWQLQEAIGDLTYSNILKSEEAPVLHRGQHAVEDTRAICNAIVEVFEHAN